VRVSGADVSFPGGGFAPTRIAGRVLGSVRVRTRLDERRRRVRGETEVNDGPFAVTKEVPAGYYVLDCPNLDEALNQAGSSRRTLSWLRRHDESEPAVIGGASSPK
jgi:hypothetical protein